MRREKKMLLASGNQRSLVYLKAYTPRYQGGSCRPTDLTENTYPSQYMRVTIPSQYIQYAHAHEHRWHTLNLHVKDLAILSPLCAACKPISRPSSSVRLQRMESPQPISAIAHAQKRKHVKQYNSTSMTLNELGANATA